MQNSIKIHLKKEEKRKKKKIFLKFSTVKKNHHTGILFRNSYSRSKEAKMPECYCLCGQGQGMGDAGK